MRIRSVLLIIIFIFANATLCAAVPIPPEVKKVVTFIYVTDEKSGNLIASGTGFFVAVKNPEKDCSAVYLVTAKHVLQKPETKLFYPFITIRLNTKDGGTKKFAISLNTEGPEKNVFMHKDSTVDLSVIPALPDQTKYDFLFLSEDFITTKEDFQKLKIREGSEVFFTGLFLPHPGKQRNYPIVRFGRVALVTDEKIAWNKVEAELYLIESTACGGNSGSPVFFYLGIEREPGSLILGPPVLKLAGVISGFFLERRFIKFIEVAKVETGIFNMGISAVVPAYKLHEILFSEELKKQRGF